MQECPLYVWMPQYVWTPSHVLMLPVFFDDVWMPAVHIQHKESMLCQTKGVSICPPYICMPPYIWMPPVCLDAPICLDDSICLNIPTYVWMPPVCLDIPHMFGHPHMFGCPPYVWMIFGCLLYIYNTKKTCFVRLRGVHMSSIHVYAPICLDTL